MHFSRGIGASPLILSVVEEGYKLPFFAFSEPAAFKSNRPALEHAEFVESALGVLCQSGRVILFGVSCLASFRGQIISTGPVVGNISRIMTRHCPMSSACAPYWDAFSELDQYTKDEIIFWKENIVFFLSPGFVFSSESVTCLDSLTPVHLVVGQFSLLTRNMFVISFGIPAKPPKVRLGGARLSSRFNGYPGLRREKADFISRLNDVDDW